MVQSLVPTEQRSLVCTPNNEKKSVSVAIFPLLVLRFFEFSLILFKGVISLVPKHFFCIFMRIRLFVLPQ